MDIMSMFRTATPAPAPAATPAGGSTQVAQPGQPLPGTSATPATANNGVVPTQDPAAPLDTFKDIWQTKPNPAEPAGPMFANIDPKKIMESAGQVDFAKAITPEQLQAISAGGEGAMNAFAQAMNKVAQTVFAQSAVATTKIVDQAIAKTQENFDARLPSMVRKLSVNEGLSTNNPILNNPALTPLVSALSEQLVRKNPNATTQEIQSQVVEYFSGIGQMFAPKPAASTQATGANTDPDWESFFSR